MTHKIAITGPESTGKSELAKALAQHYHTLWVPEFARSYLEELGRPYRYEDILRITKGQKYLEEEFMSKAERILFCDTDPLVTYIWSMYKYNRCDPWIEGRLDEKDYSLHLLCDIDLPWEPDPLREHPGKRKELFDLYLHELQQRGLPFFIVRGRGEERLLNAISAVETLVAP